MKSRTSFFNITVLRKDITRFAPVWALYAVGLLLTLLLCPDKSSGGIADLLQGLCQPIVAFNLLYGGVCAALLFGDLFVPRLCNVLHALPLRREGWFLTHLCAGALFCIVPNVLFAVVCTLFLGKFVFLAFLWLAVAVVSFLFFFGVGVFSAMCAGNRLGMAAVYGILNFLSLLAFLILSVFQPLLIGVPNNLTKLTEYCPVIRMTDDYYFLLWIHNNAVRYEGICPEQWIVLGICGGIGLLFLGLSVLLYRKRKLESAGDFISLKSIRPVFLVIFTLCAGSVLYFIGELGRGVVSYFFLFVGLAIGFFIGKMLLERKVNIFTRKAFLRFGILAASVAAVMVLIWADPAGITRYVPEDADIDFVMLTTDQQRYEIKADSPDNPYALTDPEDIHTVTRLHQSLLRTATDDPLSTRLALIYKLKNGKYVVREYEVSADTVTSEPLKKIFSSPNYVLGVTDPASLAETINCIYLNINDKPESMYACTPSVLLYQQSQIGYEGRALSLEDGNEGLVRDLLDAICKDCAEGRMAQEYLFRSDVAQYGYLSLYDVTYDGCGYSRELILSVDCTNTIAVLEQMYDMAQ